MESGLTVSHDSSVIIEFDRVSKDYRRVGRHGLAPTIKSVHALRDVHIGFKGGILGLVGPNGAGKTTMVKILAGLLKCTSGTARVFGHDPWRSSTQVKKRVGFLMESPEYPPISAERYLTYICRLRGIDKSKAGLQAGELLDLVELMDSRNRSIRGFSAGMQRRLGIAVAFAGRPELVIMDEPTKTLDPKGRRMLADLVGSYRREYGTHFVISSHILSDLEKVCLEAWILQDGRITAAGSMPELAKRFRPTRFVVEVDRPETLYEFLMSRPNRQEVYLEGHRVIISGEQDYVSALVAEAIAALGLVMHRFEPALGELERSIYGSENDGQREDGPREGDQ